MADLGIFATTAEVQNKVGAGASSVSNTEAFINDFMTQAESYINVLCRFNFSDAYAAQNIDVKGILKEAASNLAAIYVVQYDTDGYSSLREAENIINICWARFVQCTSLLRDQKQVDFMKTA